MIARGAAATTAAAACSPKKERAKEQEEMGAITSAVVAIAAVILGWITIEIACKPCLKEGRDALDRALDPNYDPDSSLIAQNPTPTDAATQPLLRDEPPFLSAPPAAKIA